METFKSKKMTDISTQFPKIPLVSSEEGLSKKKVQYLSKKKTMKIDLHLNEIAKDTGLSEDEICSASAGVHESVYGQHYTNKRGTPPELEDIDNEISNPSQDPEKQKPLSREKLLEYCKNIREKHDKSQLLRLCVRRLIPFYRKVQEEK